MTAAGYSPPHWGQGMPMFAGAERIPIGVEHPVGRFLAAVAEAGHPAVVWNVWAKPGYVMVEWDDDNPCPPEVARKAYGLVWPDRPGPHAEKVRCDPDGTVNGFCSLTIIGECWQPGAPR